MFGIVSFDDARFDGDLVAIAPQIKGNLLEVRVAEGDKVKSGQILFIIEKEALEVALNKAEAELKSAKADLLMAKANNSKILRGSRPEEIHMAEAVEQKAASSLKLAEKDFKRFQAIYNGNAVSTSKLDKVRTNYEEAKKTHEEALSNLVLLKQGSRKEDLDSARAKVEMKKARLSVAEGGVQQARVNIGFTEVCAPFDGVVARKWTSPGAMVIVGRPVLTLFNPSTMYISANIEEKNIGKIATGNIVDISVDAYPDLNLKGRVEKIINATNSRFSLIPAEGASGIYVKVNHRVPIRITVEIPTGLNLGPGLSVEVKIHHSKHSDKNNE